MRRLLLLLLALPLVLAAGCSDGGSDDASGDEAAETSAADGAEETTTTTEAEADPCTNALEVVNGEAETAAEVPDGEFEAVTMWTEGGPHPDNDIDEDQNLDLGFFTYEEPPDPQFGVSIPIDPDTPDGEHFVSFSLFNPDGPIEAGQTFIDQIDYDDDPSQADGEINFTFWEYGSDRLLPGDITITLTEITDEQVCGELATVTQTDLQTFIGLEGTFAADRSQFLEAELEAEED